MAGTQAPTRGRKGPAQKKVKPSTKHKKRKHLSQNLRSSADRSRVNIGLAFGSWRELKAEKGLKSDAEVALCLLDE